MSKQEIDDSLAQLKSEIDALTSDNPEDHDRLIGLITAVENQLDEEVSTPEDEPPRTAEGLRTMAEKFEVEHPKITQVLNRIMNALSNMGI